MNGIFQPRAGSDRSVRFVLPFSRPKGKPSRRFVGAASFAASAHFFVDVLVIVLLSAADGTHGIRRLQSRPGGARSTDVVENAAAPLMFVSDSCVDGLFGDDLFCRVSWHGGQNRRQVAARLARRWHGPAADLLSPCVATLDWHDRLGRSFVRIGFPVDFVAARKARLARFVWRAPG